MFRPDHAPQAVSRPSQAPAAMSRPTHAPAVVAGPNHLPTAVSELNHFPGLSYSRYPKSRSNTSSKLPQINENAKSNTTGTPSQGSKNVSLSIIFPCRTKGTVLFHAIMSAHGTTWGSVMWKKGLNYFPSVNSWSSVRLHLKMIRVKAWGASLSYDCGDHYFLRQRNHQCSLSKSMGCWPLTN